MDVSLSTFKDLDKSAEKESKFAHHRQSRNQDLQRSLEFMWSRLLQAFTYALYELHGNVRCVKVRALNQLSNFRLCPFRLLGDDRLRNNSFFYASWHREEYLGALYWYDWNLNNIIYRWTIKDQSDCSTCATSTVSARLSEFPLSDINDESTIDIFHNADKFCSKMEFDIYSKQRTISSKYSLRG